MTWGSYVRQSGGTADSCDDTLLAVIHVLGACNRSIVQVLSSGHCTTFSAFLQKRRRRLIFIPYIKSGHLSPPLSPPTAAIIIVRLLWRDNAFAWLSIALSPYNCSFQPCKILFTDLATITARRNDVLRQGARPAR
jgi:hypothetical protein